MLKFSLIALAAATTISAIPNIASADEYYVVRRPKTRECTVVESRPRDTTLLQVGPLAFKTRDEADRQRTVLCQNKFDDED